MELIALVLMAIVFLLIGIPVAFAFGMSGMIMGAYMSLVQGSLYLLPLLPDRLFGILNNSSLVVIPLFIFMGLVLQKSGIAQNLIEAIAKLFKNIRGGVGVGVILIGVLLGASTGIVGATIVMLGSIAVPAMLKANYDKRLIAGVVVASGTLGQIIPPSIVLILLADVLRVSIRDLFSAAVLPGLMLGFVYILFVLLLAFIFPSHAPIFRQKQEDKTDFFELFLVIVPPILLILLVLGSIIFGLIEPNSAAALGVLGAILLCVWYHKFKLSMLWEVSKETLLFCGMIFAILIGANCFTLIFGELGGDRAVLEFFKNYLDSPLYFVLVAMLVIFVLGFFIDFFEICYIVLPILAGIALHYKVDMLWFALLIAINLQTSFLTPPFGFSIFFFKSSVGNLIKTHHIYWGVIPFVFLQLGVLAFFFYFPQWVLHSRDWLAFFDWF